MNIAKYVLRAMALIAMLFVGCAGPDYPEEQPGMGQSAVEPYDAGEDPIYTCTSGRRCVDYGSCCRMDGDHCGSRCLGCALPDTREASFQCYEVHVGTP